MQTLRLRSLLRSGVVGVLLTLGATADARAQAFISPQIGFNFGGDANCPSVTNCDNKRLTYGVALGAMGSVLGFEEDFAWSPDFFGSSPSYSSNMFSLMTNAMLIPRIGPIRPYALAGLGLIKTHVEATPASLLSTDNNNFGWDVGGGILFLFGHFGARGDIRYFHSFQELDLGPINIQSEKVNFGRASIAFVAAF